MYLTRCTECVVAFIPASLVYRHYSRAGRVKLLVIERKVLDNAELISVLWTDLLISKGGLPSLLHYLGF